MNYLMGMAGLCCIVISEWRWISMPYFVSFHSGKPLVAKQFWRRVSSFGQPRGCCTIRFLMPKGHGGIKRPVAVQSFRGHVTTAMHTIWVGSHCVHLVWDWIIRPYTKRNSWWSAHGWFLRVAPNAKGLKGWHQMQRFLSLLHSLTCEAKIWLSWITLPPCILFDG